MHAAVSKPSLLLQTQNTVSVQSTAAVWVLGRLPPPWLQWQQQSISMIHVAHMPRCRTSLHHPKVHVPGLCMTDENRQPHLKLLQHCTITTSQFEMRKVQRWFMGPHAVIAAVLPEWYEASLTRIFHWIIWYKTIAPTWDYLFFLQQLSCPPFLHSNQVYAPLKIVKCPLWGDLHLFIHIPCVVLHHTYTNLKEMYSKIIMEWFMYLSEVSYPQIQCGEKYPQSTHVVCNSSKLWTTCSKHRTQLHHHTWHENSGAVCFTLVPSPQQMTGCPTSWKTSVNSLASIYDFQNCSIGSEVWRDHTKAVPLKEDKPEWLRPVRTEKNLFSGWQPSHRTHLV